MQQAFELTRHILLLALSVVCVYTDLARGKLYNAVTIPCIVLGLALAFWMDARVPGFPFLKRALLAVALGGGVLLVLYLVGALGAGDVKFMAAIGALAPLGPIGTGWRFVALALMYTALVGAAIAIGILIWQGRLLQGLKESARTFFTLRPKHKEGTPATKVPYGIAIGVGTLWAWTAMYVL